MPEQPPVQEDGTSPLPTAHDVRVFRVPINRENVARGVIRDPVMHVHAEVRLDLEADGLVSVGHMTVRMEDTDDPQYDLAIAEVRVMSRAAADDGACPRCGGPRKVEPAYGWPQGRLRCRRCT